MNKETIQLSMTAQEADSLAFVLMAALRTVTMMGSERKTATEAANDLFSQIGYDVRTTDNGARIEPKPAKPATSLPEPATGIVADNGGEMETRVVGIM